MIHNFIKLNIKFIVIMVLVVNSNCSEYCEICPNHTLCKYPMSGPSHTCKGYDKSSLLTRDDIVDILSRINERRNFIALGYSKRLPPAANMRKINWSEDLAWSAQRWVDQCDPSVHPDKHDLCRDLEDTPVGQNIATIFGPAPGLSVKSFVDIWFMQTLDYTGNVSLFDRSLDSKTQYFTQLMWAETGSVGCGKARFHIEYNIQVERLVCNFAPSGNIDGKSVYVIGVPATQCPDNSYTHELYAGLCTCQDQSSTKFTFGSSPPVTSLLRILNLPNSSVKRRIEIDPIKNTVRKPNIDDDENDDHRHHKLRHVVNGSHDGISRFLQYPPLTWNNFNISRNHHYLPDRMQPRVYHGNKFDQSFLPDRVQPRIYHDNNLGQNFIPPYTATVQENYRRFDVVTRLPVLPVLPQANGNFRRFNPYHQCTRRPPGNCIEPEPVFINRCTRGQHNVHGAAEPCMSNVEIPYVLPHTECPYSFPTCEPPISHSPCCEVACHCSCHKGTPPTCCPEIARTEHPVAKDETRKSGEIHYYDLAPNAARRSGELSNEKITDVLPSDKKKWLLWITPSVRENNQITQEKRKRGNSISRNKERMQSSQVTLPSYVEEELDLAYESSNFKKRFNRESIQQNIYRPRWNVYENGNENPLILRSLRYTTLLNKKRRKSWQPTHNTRDSTTEPITIEVESHDEHDDFTDVRHSTEKYLSFDELLRLRNIYSSEFNARRQVKGEATKATKSAATKVAATKATKAAATTKKTAAKTAATTKKAAATTAKAAATTKKAAAATTKAAASTTKAAAIGSSITYSYNDTDRLIPTIKYCTRRLTCTWTMFTATAADGSFINIGPQQGGSRTPPGYIEGCTRTSTCTRAFMDRNKISTVPMSTLPGEGEEDEDYCEKRSLNVQKRNSNDDSTRERSFNRGFRINVTQNFGIANQSSILEGLTMEPFENCTCISNTMSKNIRHKRKVIDKKILRCDHCGHKKEGLYKNPLMSYGDLYYLVLKKLTITESEKKSHKCPCNSGLRFEIHTVTIILLASASIIIIY